MLSWWPWVSETCLEAVSDHDRFMIPRLGALLWCWRISSGGSPFYREWSSPAGVEMAVGNWFDWFCLPGGSDSKESACNVADLGLIPGSGRSPGEGNSKPLQYSCLENPTDGGAWWATVHGVAESDTTKWLTLHFTIEVSCCLRSLWIKLFSLLSRLLW